MKKWIEFSKHAEKRMKERVGWRKYAVHKVQQAEKIHETKDGTVIYKNGVYRFVVVETEKRMKVVTIMNDL